MLLAAAVGAPCIAIGLGWANEASAEQTRYSATAMVYAWDARLVTGERPTKPLGPFTPWTQEESDAVLNRPIPADESAQANRIAADGVQVTLATETASMYDARHSLGYGLAGFGFVFVVTAVMQQSARREQL